MTASEAKAALSDFAMAYVSDREVRTALSGHIAAYVAAVVREERASANQRIRREIDALIAADNARDHGIGSDFLRKVMGL